MGPFTWELAMVLWALCFMRGFFSRYHVAWWFAASFFAVLALEY